MKYEVITELKDGAKLCVNIDSWGGDEPNECSIFIVKDGLIWQDLAIIRPHYDGANNEWHNDKIDMLIYSDSEVEDWTHFFEVDIYEEM